MIFNLNVVNLGLFKQCIKNIERIMDHFDENINKLGFQIADDSTKSFHRKC